SNKRGSRNQNLADRSQHRRRSRGSPLKYKALLLLQAFWFPILFVCGMTMELHQQGGTMRYRLTRLVGEGSFGRVFQAEGPNGNVVAIKRTKVRCHGLMIITTRV